MPPVIAAIGAIAGAIGAVAASIGAAWGAIGVWAGINASLWAAAGRLLLSFAISAATSKLFSPKTPRISVSQRQASVLELSLGEMPREAIFGRACTGGTLVNAFNYGNDNEYEVLVIAIADHECDALESFFVNDREYEFTGDFELDHADFVDDPDIVLSVTWRNGAPTNDPNSIIQEYGVPAGEFDASDVLRGMAHVVVRYRWSDKVWASGRPAFKWVVRGLKCYDPRLDSTVPGGDGPQRWGEWWNYAWSENARVCHANFVWGVWNYAADPPQLMVGPGKSFEEVPAESVIADANLCDENVSLKAGGTEKRYTAGCVVRANEPWIEVENNFALAMGGELVERAGMIGIDPGAAKSIVFEFSDADLLSGLEMTYQGKVGRDDLVNTVVARYVDPARLWEGSAAPMRRSLADIEADGEPRELGLDLAYVTSGTQAQRCAEIARRKARLQPTAVVAMGPKFMVVEDGDWGKWTSARRFGGGYRHFEAQGVTHDDEGRTRLALKQITSDVFSWNPAVDELDVQMPAYLPPGAIPPAQVENFDAVPHEITGPGGASAGAIKATWTPPTDASIALIRLEYRPIGSEATIVISVDPRPGEYVISVLPVTDVDYEIRATPEPQPRRDALTTAWREVVLSAPLSPPIPPANFAGYQNRDVIRFTWTPFADSTLRYEIRAGATFDLGRYVDNIAGGSTMVTWPIASEDDEVLFWIKTIHRSGVYSESAALWVASVANIGDRNFVLAEDFKEDEFPGIRHAMTDDVAEGEPALALDQEGGSSLLRGDYYAEIELLREFYARTWLEQRASSFINDVPVWEDTESSWDELGDADWEPDIGDPGAARLDSFIAVNAPLPSTLIEGFRLNGTLEGARGLLPYLDEGVGYAPAKAAQGATLSETGALWYAIDFEVAASIACDVRVTETPDIDVPLLTASNSAGAYLQLWRRASDGFFVLDGDVGDPIEIDCPCEADDTLSIAIWKNEAARGLVMATRKHGFIAALNVEVASSALYTDLSVGGSSVEGLAWEDTEETWNEAESTWTQSAELGPDAPAFPGVFGDLAIYDSETFGASFQQRWENRGPIGHADFVPFIAGEYLFEAAVVWMRLTAPEPFVQVLSITRAKMNVDVPDVIDRGEADVEAGGSWVTFARPFYNPPSVNATPRAAEGVMGSPTVQVREDVEPDRFFVTLFASDDPSTSVAGRISYAANGF